MANLLTRFGSHVATGMKSLRFGLDKQNGFSSGYFDYNGNFVTRLMQGGVDYAAKAGDLWSNPTVLSGTKFICDSYPEADQIVQRRNAKGQWEPVFDHPLTELFLTPWPGNPIYTSEILSNGIIISLTVRGNAFAYKLRNEFGAVIGLLYLPHFTMKPISDTSTSFVDAWAYTINGKTQRLPAEDVVHFRDGVDPRDCRLGLSRLGAVLISVCSENEADQYEYALLANAGVPSVIITPKLPGDRFMEPTRKELKRLYREETTGVNRGGAIVPSTPIEIHPLGFSPEQLALDKMASIAPLKICSALSLDPMVLGLASESKTYDNYPEARRAAYETCLIPMHRRIDAQATSQLGGDVPAAKKGDRLARDYRYVRALQEDQAELVARTVEAFQGMVIKRSTAKRWLHEDVDEKADDVYVNDLVTFRQATGEGGSGSGSGSGDGKPKKFYIMGRNGSEASRVEAK